MNNRNNSFTKLPKELVNVVLDYYGHIKYKYKIKNSIDYHTYVNIIHKHDDRYSIITPIINKKIQIIKDMVMSSNKLGFEFMFNFDKHPCMILRYENNMSVPDKFFISYVNMKEPRAILIGDIIRTTYN